MSQGHADCPAKCNCTEEAVLCINQKLETIPKLLYLETSPIVLDFSGNKLLFVSQEDFNFLNCDEVKEIYLNNSEIADIGFAAFDELESLQELYLGQNYLNAISDTIIEPLDNMILLDISNNYFNGDLPVIRSESLEVLVVANSKISNVSPKSLRHLPNLKLLLLQQNNIQTLTTDVFDRFQPNAMLIKLSFNSWKCNCDNVQAFETMEHRNFIDPSEPYQCVLESNQMINIFGTNGAIENMSQQCNELNNGLQVRDMIDDKRRGLKNLPPNNFGTDLKDTENSEEDDDSEELDIKEMNDKDLENALPGTCWEQFTNTNIKNNYFLMTIIAVAISFVIGFVSGTVFYKILCSMRCKKREQNSDSQVHLLRA